MMQRNMRLYGNNNQQRKRCGIALVLLHKQIENKIKTEIEIKTRRNRTYSYKTGKNLFNLTNYSQNSPGLLLLKIQYG